VELWDVPTGRRLATVAVPHVERALVADDGFVTLATGRAELWRCPPAGCHGAVLAPSGATAIAPGRQQILVAAGAEVRRFAPSGVIERTIPLSAGITALLATGNHLFAGFTDGAVEMRALEGASAAPLRLKDTPTRPVTALTEGPLGTLAAGYANGAVGLWSLADGRQLDRAKLHGSVVHLVVRDGRLHAATDLGDHLTWDLSLALRPYCDLLGEVWAQVPVVWDGQRPVRRSPSADHPCADRRGAR